MDYLLVYLQKMLAKLTEWRKIDSGVIWINTWLLRDLRIPFGGMKSSD